MSGYIGLFLMVYIIMGQLWLAVKSKRIIRDSDLANVFPKSLGFFGAGYGKRMKWLKQHEASLSIKEQKALGKLNAIEYSLYIALTVLFGVYIVGCL